MKKLVLAMQMAIMLVSSAFSGEAGKQLSAAAADMKTTFPAVPAPTKAAASVPNPLSKRYPLVIPPVCQSFMGLRVNFQPISKAELDSIGIILAAAHPSPTNPLVVFDGQTLSRTPPEFQRQILLHECAHKSLGPMGSGSPEEEAAADCYAAKRLSNEYGYGRKELNTIAEYTRYILKREGIPPAIIEDKITAVSACF